MIQFKKADITWKLAPDFAPLLEGVLASAGKPVKQTPTKLVTVHELGGVTYYVKRYLNAGVPLRPLKYFFKKSEAKIEWIMAQRYEALGIPLVRHLALGERWTPLGLQESILVTEGFDGVPLSRGAPHQRPDVQAALGKLLGQMHDHGILQPDLHHNILVRPDPLELRRIDIDRGEIRSGLTDQERIDNLAWLNVSVPLSDAFFSAYGADAGFVRMTQQRRTILRRESREKYSWRSLGDNLRFETKTFGGMKWHVRKEFFRESLQRVLENPDAPTDGFTVRRFERAGLFQSPALQAYRMAYHLELLDIPTPRPIAGASRYCVTERVAGKPCPPDAALMEILQREGFALDGEVGTDAFLASDDGRVLVARVDQLKFQMPTQSK